MHRRKFNRSVTSPAIGKKPQHVSRMTIQGDTEEGRGIHNSLESPVRKNHSQGIEDSSSWDQQSGATSASWPEDMEEAATRKVISYWEAVERTLYDEENQVRSGSVYDECVQWRTQIPHLRIVGQCPVSMQKIYRPDTSLKKKTGNILENSSIENEETYAEHKLPQDLDNSSKHQQRDKSRKAILQLIMEFLCRQLSLDEQESDLLSNELDMVLRITPAPTYSGKNPRSRVSAKSRIDDEENKVLLEERMFLASGGSLISARRQNVSRDANEENFLIERERLYTPQLSRNKLGTVFNEKIVVSPVPFVVTTRESFSTLKTIPIRFMEQSLEITAPQRSARLVESGFKSSSARRAALARIPQVQSAWQAPVCPTIWPKNVRLAPIDTSRLPSSKNRSLATSPTSVPRSRNSLIPISRDMVLVSPLVSQNNNLESLEIQGRQISAQTSKSSLLKPGWDSSPRIMKKTRKKTRGKVAR
ncbi:uncharacterized protein LOC107264531 isoform X2 [Cephus cinctus]|uniref:Uncharacterized protein LOC107264531 isoform X2 n=1 Tax=Cephus cinctus TaxID=211228 RepID=A0AAJ7BKL4_CEPCN|nr:uncharacterized protein LOC107264531 isoform X2 [Cephus cinctus]